MSSLKGSPSYPQGMEYLNIITSRDFVLVIRLSLAKCTILYFLVGFLMKKGNKKVVLVNFKKLMHTSRTRCTSVLLLQKFQVNFEQRREHDSRSQPPGELQDFS